MARKRPTPAAEDDDLRGRIDLRVDSALERRFKRQAKRFTSGNVSAYLRLAGIERLERDEATDPHKDDE